MNPLELHLENVGPIAEDTIAIPDGITVIAGQNGSGKTTRVDALELALFADGSRDLDGYLGPHADHLQIELVFEHAGERWRVRRRYRRSANGSGTAWLDLERHVFSGANGPSDAPGGWHVETREKTSATQSYLEQIIGLSRRTFRASSFGRQGELGSFAREKPADRKAVLGEALDPEGGWQKLCDLARAERGEAQEEATRLAGLIADREQRIAERPALDAEHERLHASLAAADAALRVSEDALEAAQSALSACSVAAERIARMSVSRDSAAAEHARATAQLTAAKEAERELPALTAHLEELRRSASRLPDLEQERDAAKASAAARESTLARIKTLEENALAIEREAERIRRDGTELAERLQARQRTLVHFSAAEDGTARCDRCEQILGADARKAALASLEAELDDLKAQVSAKAELVLERERDAEAEREKAAAVTVPEAIAFDMVDYSNAQTDAARLPAAEQRERTLAVQAAEIDAHIAAADLAENALLDAERKFAEASAAAGDQEALERAVAHARVDVDARRRERDEHTANLARVRERLDRVEDAEQELAELVERGSEIQLRLDLLRLAERAFGRDGIPALIAENVAVPMIEAEANRRVLEKMPMPDGMLLRVELHTQRTLKSSDRLKDTLDVVAYLGDQARPYERFSGGEKARLDLALRVGLAMVMRSRRGAQSDLLVIDEIEGLDAVGQEALVGVLRDLEGVFGKIVVASHYEGIRDAFGSSLRVVKEGGVSRSVTAGVEAVPA